MVRVPILENLLSSYVVIDPAGRGFQRIVETCTRIGKSVTNGMKPPCPGQPTLEHQILEMKNTAGSPSHVNFLGHLDAFY